MHIKYGSATKWELQDRLLTCCKRGEHAKRRTRDAEHVGKREADKDGNRNHDARDNCGLVAERQPENDVGCSPRATRVGNILQS